MRLIIEKDYADVSRWAGNYVASRINAANPTPEHPFVLGCPTGSSPLGMYRRLIELYKEGKVSFANVVTFNMDEYVGLPQEHSESYHSFMWNNFFSHIDIKPENVNILDGNAADLEAECKRFEDKSPATAASTSSWVALAPTVISHSTSPARRSLRALASKPLHRIRLSPTRASSKAIPTSFPRLLSQ